MRGHSPLYCTIYALGAYPTRVKRSQWSRCFHSLSANEPATRAALWYSDQLSVATGSTHLIRPASPHKRSSE